MQRSLSALPYSRFDLISFGLRILLVLHFTFVGLLSAAGVDALPETVEAASAISENVAPASSTSPGSLEPYIGYDRDRDLVHSYAVKLGKLLRGELCSDSPMPRNAREAVNGGCVEIGGPHLPAKKFRRLGGGIEVPSPGSPLRLWAQDFQPGKMSPAPCGRAPPAVSLVAA